MFSIKYSKLLFELKLLFILNISLNFLLLLLIEFKSDTPKPFKQYCGAP